MPIFPGDHLPRLNTDCRTTSVATSVESHVLRDRFWDAFALDTGAELDSPTRRNNDAHGPSAYRGLSAIERLRHLGSALYPSNETVRETSSWSQPDRFREQRGSNHVIPNGEVQLRDKSPAPVASPVDRTSTAVLPRHESLARQDAFAAESDTARPIPQPDSQPSELPRASPFLNLRVTNREHYLDSSRPPASDENYVQDLDLRTIDDFFENVRITNSDRSVRYELPREIYERPRSPKSRRPTEGFGYGLGEKQLRLPTIYEKRSTSTSDPAKKRWCGNWTPDALMMFTFGSDCLSSMSM